LASTLAWATNQIFSLWRRASTPIDTFRILVSLNWLMPSIRNADHSVGSFSKTVPGITHHNSQWTDSSRPLTGSSTIKRALGKQIEMIIMWSVSSWLFLSLFQVRRFLDKSRSVQCNLSLMSTYSVTEIHGFPSRRYWCSACIYILSFHISMKLLRLCWHMIPFWRWPSYSILKNQQPDADRNELNPVQNVDLPSWSFLTIVYVMWTHHSESLQWLESCSEICAFPAETSPISVCIPAGADGSTETSPAKHPKSMERCVNLFCNTAMAPSYCFAFSSSLASHLPASAFSVSFNPVPQCGPLHCFQSLADWFLKGNDDELRKQAKTISFNFRLLTVENLRKMIFEICKTHCKTVPST
jgi:hypothetical protein